MDVIARNLTQETKELREKSKHKESNRKMEFVTFVMEHSVSRITRIRVLFNYCDKNTRVFLQIMY